MRVVSLVPSVTETLLAWGVAPAAVTRFCEAPGIPTVGGTKNPDIAGIVRLKPDLVVMDKEENRQADAEALTSEGVEVHVTAVRSLEDVPATLDKLAGAIGLESPPMETLESRAGPARIRAWIPIWRRPWMTINGDTYGSTILAAAGIDNVFQKESEPYPETSVEEARSRRPDVVLAPSEPYPFKEKHRAELETVAPTVFVDGQDLFWWGERTPAALHRLRNLAGGLASR